MKEDQKASSSCFSRAGTGSAALGHLITLSVLFMPLKLLRHPQVQAPIPETHSQSDTFSVDGTPMLLAMTSMPSQVIPNRVDSCTFVISKDQPSSFNPVQNCPFSFSKETPSIKLQLKEWQRDSLRWQHGFPFLVLFPRTLVRRWKQFPLKCLPGSAITRQPKGSFLVTFRALTVLSLSYPEGNPPPMSMVVISWPQILPISKHLLANLTAFPKPEEPCCPDPQWKWIPLSLMPIYSISCILEWISWSVLMSSPNFPENWVARLSLSSSWMAIRQRTPMLGAICLILMSSSMESAVVYFTPLCQAHWRSLSSLIELEQTMESLSAPTFITDSSSVLEAQSNPAPSLCRSLSRGRAGLDLMAQWGRIQGSAFFQADSLRTAYCQLQTRQLDWRLWLLRIELISDVCWWSKTRLSFPLRKQIEQGCELLRTSRLPLARQLQETVLNSVPNFNGLWSTVENQFHLNIVELIISDQPTCHSLSRPSSPLNLKYPLPSPPSLMTYSPPSLPPPCPLMNFSKNCLPLQIVEEMFQKSRKRMLI